MLLDGLEPGPKATRSARRRSASCSRRRSCSCSRRRRARTWPSVRAGSAGPRRAWRRRSTKRSRWSGLPADRVRRPAPLLALGRRAAPPGARRRARHAPATLLLDEPFVSLDPATRRELAAILRDLRGRRRHARAGHARRRPGVGAVRAASRAGGCGRWWRDGPGDRRRRRGACSPASRHAGAVRRRAVAAPRPRRRRGAAHDRRGGGGAGVRTTIAQYYPADSPVHRLDPRASSSPSPPLAVALFVRTRSPHWPCSPAPGGRPRPQPGAARVVRARAAAAPLAGRLDLPRAGAVRARAGALPPGSLHPSGTGLRAGGVPEPAAGRAGASRACCSP